jgi:hypothetical protein
MKKYWYSFVRTSGGYTRTCRITKIKVINPDNDRYAVVEATMSLSSYSSALWALILFGCPGLLLAAIIIAVTQKKDKLKVRKLMIKSNEIWYVAESEFKGVLDGIKM